MKTHQKGFSVVEILIVVVIVGLVVGIGGYVWQSKSKTSKSAAESAHPTDETANWKSHTRYGITYKYPADWGFKANNSTQSRATYLTSPNSTDDGSPNEHITVDDSLFTQTGLTADTFKAKQLDANANEYSDYKTLTVNGKKAGQFYLGDSRTTVFFLANGKTVIFLLDTLPDPEAVSTTYNKVIETVTIN